MEVLLVLALEVVLVLELEAVELVLEPALVPELVVVALGTQDSLEATIGSVTGRFIADTGVPAGTLTSNVSVWPLLNVTVTAH